MIRTLRLENYRSFKEYEVRDLARVNLWVGRNDCGKTSVLEAIAARVARRYAVFEIVVGEGGGWCRERDVGEVTMSVPIVRWTITLLAIVAAVAHIFVSSVEIDTVTITLLALACVPWAGELFRALEIPGVLRVEGRDLRKTTDPIAESRVIPVLEDSKPEPRRRHVYAFETVAGSDRNMVLAGLRVEIESRIRGIARSRGIAGENRSLRGVIDQLASQGVIPREQARVIADLLPILSSAVHGASVDRPAVEWALDFGPYLLEALEEHVGKISIPDLIARWRRRDGALFYEIGTDLSKALAKSPRAFLRAMANDPESFDSWIQGLETHTFILHAPDDDLEQELYRAYYEKLKHLMEDRLRSLLPTDLKDEASRVLTALSDVNIREIW